MPMIDIILVAAAAGLVILAIRSALRATKQGSCAGCSGGSDCRNCAKNHGHDQKAASVKADAFTPE